jgi:hydroxymethylbilane synthase
MARLCIGSRGSQLALWQANYVADQLRQRGHEVILRTITTTGDKITEVALAQVGSKGMFIKEIEEALLAGEIDLAVHSFKDVPTEIPPDLEIAAITSRENPFDAFVSLRFGDFAELPPGARVGTSSLRRQAQLKAVRPDLNVVPLRGNVDTRLRKLTDGSCDALVLASAGLERLGRKEFVREIFSPDVMCPAVGQGALAVETRRGDSLKAELKFLDNQQTRVAVTAERALLRRLGGGCQVPIGGYAEIVGTQIQLIGIVALPDGSELLRETQAGEDAEELGNVIAESLLSRGGDAILRKVYGRAAAVPQQP